MLDATTHLVLTVVLVTLVVMKAVLRHEDTREVAIRLKMADTKETNIQVVVRVRPRNAKEVRENSAAIISTNGVKCKELSVRTSANDARTYSFDKVFGPDADQSAIYSDVVSPILDEVLMGYNCTIFAYGQTGTGKTYTMEGDLDDCKGRHAGIIPRTLYNLFDRLEKDTPEFSVRVSFLEIYNEELRDLLSSDDAAAPKLKIFEDVNRKGSNDVHGMERILVTSAEDVISVLQKGSFKRQIAATKMNEASSRSHCIFTITVHIKDTTADGEDLLKIGKLNLVDLAGSENVGRSGAERGRAKEAGMINQSLLTLGRVINSLVEKSIHIPYRESKLTRLLQDSLGGKTKTCIIAAVSPAKINFEESLSTLDYAHRAKNIRNKPEVNQRMTKKALMRDYETQIERLKLDLQATRDKNGVYLAAETYKDLVESGQSRKDRIDEMEKTVTAKEAAILKLEADYRQQMDMLKATQKELNGTQEELQIQTRTLSEALGSVNLLTKDLNEQKVLTEAHANTEQNLHSLHSGLVAFMHGAVNDNYGLHAKIERKSAVEFSNMRLFNEFQNGILREMSTLDAGLENFKQASTEFIQQLEEKMKAFQESQQKVSMNLEEESTQISSSIRAQLDAIKHNQSCAFNSSTKNLVDLLNLGVSLHESAQKQNDSNQNQWIESHTSIQNLVSSHNDQISQWHDQMKNRIEALVNSSKTSMDLQRNQYTQLLETASAAKNEEIALLKAQNAQLKEKLALHSRNRQESESKLMSSIAHLVSSFTQESQQRDQEIQEIASENADALMQMNGASLLRLNTASEQDTHAVEAAIGAFDKDQENIDGVLDSGFEALTQSCCGLESSLDLASNLFTTGTAALSKKMDSGIRALSAVHSEKAESMLSDFGQHQQEVESSAAMVQTRLSEFGCQIANERDKIVEKVQDFEKLAQLFEVANGTFMGDSTATVAKARSEIQCKRMTLDEPTGSTPRKKKINVPLDWVKTRSHDDILSELRSLQDGSIPTTSERVQGPVAVPSKRGFNEIQSSPKKDADSPNKVDSVASLDVSCSVAEDDENIAPAANVASEKSDAAPVLTRTLGRVRGRASASTLSNSGSGGVASAGNGLSKLPMMRKRSDSPFS
ncbi:kinesin motor protein cin8 [Chytriomyces hyalinus]|nr:kinesin motor protein cin8 [Chytriomyces hyalinus]